MEKYLRMVFTTDQDRKVSIRVSVPRDDLTSSIYALGFILCYAFVVFFYRVIATLFPYVHKWPL